jgi:hypothetical protein
VGRKMFGNHDNDTPDADTWSGGMGRASGLQRLHRILARIDEGAALRKADCNTCTEFWHVQAEPLRRHSGRLRRPPTMNRAHRTKEDRECMRGPHVRAEATAAGAPARRS